MVLINISDYTAESGKDLDMAFDLNMKISVSLCCYIFSILKSLYEDDSFLEMSALRFSKKKKKVNCRRNHSSSSFHRNVWPCRREMK